MDFAIAGCAAVGAGFFTNPLEVMKVRMQLQGELQARGQHAVHYKNVFHAGYVIAKHDGILALQAGLTPALWFQVFLNGFRLGSYQTLLNRGFLHDEKHRLVFYKSVIAAGICGAGGAFIGSPMFLVKTHLQTRAAKEIACGYQHNHDGMVKAFINIYRNNGIQGLFRGASSSLPRAFVGSTAQLTSFDYSKVYLQNYKWFEGRPLLTSFASSMIGGVMLAMFFCPFDLITTRLYNQGVDANGRGVLYKNYFDCVVKIFQSEGFLGFYKGLGACYFRIGPHTVLTLVFWDLLKDRYEATKLKG